MLRVANISFMTVKVHTAFKWKHKILNLDINHPLRRDQSLLVMKHKKIPNCFYIQLLMNENEIEKIIWLCLLNSVIFTITRLSYFYAECTIDKELFVNDFYVN